MTALWTDGNRQRGPRTEWGDPPPAAGGAPRPVMAIFLAGKELEPECAEPLMRPHPRGRNRRLWHPGTSVPCLHPPPGEGGRGV